MSNLNIPGIGEINENYQKELISLKCSGYNLYQVGINGVKAIYTPLDRKVEYIVYEDQTLVLVKSAMGHPAIYPLQEAQYMEPGEVVLMDLDGTSVKSESFWIWIIEQTISRLLDDNSFTLEAEDEPHVSGHSVSEHLQYCINKYCPKKKLEEARNNYFAITDNEMKKIREGRGRDNAFQPAPGLKEFLLTLKEQKIKIGLVTSGLYEKAWPEILSAFRSLGMGDPLDFYDTIITAGQALKRGQTGTIGELAPKPHPWLYAEAARVGLGISSKKRHKVIGIEDSGAGILSLRLAGFNAIGIKGGNIDKSGTNHLLQRKYDCLLDALPLILNKS